MADKKTVLDTDLEKEGIEEEKAKFLQKEPTSGEKNKEMRKGERDADITSEEGREELIKNDEISPQEEAFAEGAEDKGELGTCAYCGKPLSQDPEKVVEKEIDGEKVWFCSEEHAKKGKKTE
ncbi:hypothetical protein GF358_01300 [Candidatus Woesearchaeota archaeon]|nr:hypothetical protein [Candidatus Woesearchaeota archaeon]